MNAPERPTGQIPVAPAPAGDRPDRPRAGWRAVRTRPRWTRPRWTRPGWTRPRWTRRWPSALAGAGPLAAVVLAGLLGGWLGLAVAGSTTAELGPVDARLSLRPALTGDTVLQIPPLGSLTLDTHDGPLRLHAEVVRVDPADARRILGDPAVLAGIEQRIVGDVRAGVTRLVLRSTAAALGGAAVVGLLLLRRTRRAAAAAGVAAAVLAGSGLGAWASADARAVARPRYDGLLTVAPTLVGSVEDIVGNFGRYSTQLAKLVANVSQLYAVTSALPAYDPSPDTVRVLVVADIHLNPAAFEVMRSVATQFETDLVVDAGDLTDHGTAAEDRFADLIATMGQPYVFVRGNHDSVRTEAAVARQPTALVLRDGVVEQVAGLTVAGAADPRFTPDQSTREGTPPDIVERTGADLAGQLQARGSAAPPVALTVVHDPVMAGPLDGVVPLVVAGHGHQREVRRLPGGTVLFEQGSTGGAGLRGLEGEEPTPIQLSVLYLDAATGALQAWDDIDVGGLGLASAKIERHLPGDLDVESAEAVAPPAAAVDGVRRAPPGLPERP